MPLLLNPTYTQDFSCDTPTNFINDVSAYASTLDTWDDIYNLDITIRKAVNKCMLGETVTEDIGLTRTKPVPINEWLEIDSGKVRIVSVEDNADVSNYLNSSIDEEDKLVVLEVEYQCIQEDVDATCYGMDFAGYAGSYISQGGMVLGVAITFLEDRDEDISSKQGYSGTILTGKTVLFIPQDEVLNIWKPRLNVNGKRVDAFFSLSE